MIHTNSGIASVPDHDDVVVVRWPEHRDDAERLARLHRPHLLLVAADAPPPTVQGCLTDWIRLPADDDDIEARMVALAARAEQHPAIPTLDAFGELSFRGQRVYLSPTDARVAEALIASFDRGVADADLFQLIWDGHGDTSKVRVHISRLRKRIRPLGLEIASIRGVGHRLHVEHARARDDRSTTE